MESLWFWALWPLVIFAAIGDFSFALPRGQVSSGLVTPPLVIVGSLLASPLLVTPPVLCRSGAMGRGVTAVT